MRTAILLMLILSMADTSYAEIYKYKDKDGKIRFSNVPVSDEMESTGNQSGNTVSTENVLLFPYQVIEGSAAKSGLWEDHKGVDISHAKPVIIPKGAQYKLIKMHSAPFNEEGKKVTLSVAEVLVTAEGFKDLQGRSINFKELRGFVLAERLR